MHKLRQKIDQFFFQPIGSPEFLVFFRVALGVIILLHFSATILDFDKLFGRGSIVPQELITAYQSEWILSFYQVQNFFEKLGIPASTTVFKLIYFLCCFCIITGFYSRLSAFVLLITQVVLVKSASLFIYGVDFFTSMALFYLILFPADNYYALRNRVFNRTPKFSNYMPIKRMFQIHLCMAYCFSGFDKLLGVNWHNGESIWKAINLPYANRDFGFEFGFLAEHSYILVLIGWSTIVIELCYPLFVWNRWTRKFWVMLTISMHLGIALVLNLYFFSAIMIVWNMTNFYFEGAQKSVPHELIAQRA
jgi:hypothetical protein